VFPTGILPVPNSCLRREGKGRKKGGEGGYTSLESAISTAAVGVEGGRKEKLAASEGACSASGPVRIGDVYAHKKKEGLNPDRLEEGRPVQRFEESLT